MTTIKRDKTGKFVKGSKGGGRKAIPTEIKEALTKLVPESVEKLEMLIKTSKDERILLEAVKVVFDRVYGKATQQIEHTGDVVFEIKLPDFKRVTNE